MVVATVVAAKAVVTVEGRAAATVVVATVTVATAVVTVVARAVATGVVATVAVAMVVAMAGDSVEAEMEVVAMEAETAAG